MASDIGWSWCPHCKKWVPETIMSIDVDEDGRVLRMCEPCMDGTSSESNYVYDPHHEEVQCIYCDSYNTVEQAPNWGTYRCEDCGETFKEM